MYIECHIGCKVYPVPKNLNNCQIKKEVSPKPTECTLPVTRSVFQHCLLTTMKKECSLFPLQHLSSTRKSEGRANKISCNCHSTFLHPAKM